MTLLRQLEFPNVLRFFGGVLALVGWASVAPAQRWTGGQLSQARWSLTASTLDGQAVFIGGQTGNNLASDRIDFYDPQSGSWTQSQLRFGRYGLASTVNGNILAIAGGIDLTSRPTRHVEMYDASTGLWTYHNLTVPRSFMGAASVGTKILFAGGQSNTLTDRVDIYDTATDNWSMASLSQARSNVGCVTIGDKVVFAGGWIGQGVTDRVDIYDNSNGTWSTASLSEARSGPGAAVSDGKAIFAGGGISQTLSATDAVDIYDPATDTWTTDTLAVPRSLMASVSAGGKAFFYGGYETQGTPGVSNRLESFDADTGNWTTSNFGTERWLPVGTAVNDTIVFAGGDGTANVSANVEIGELPFGSSYCGATIANSAGLYSGLDAYGCDIATQNDLTIEGTDLPANAFALFLISNAQGSIPNLGGGAGTLCLGGSIGRFNSQIQNSGPAGRIELMVNTSAAPHPVQGTVAITAGQTWNFQAWYRDMTTSGPASNMTSGLEVAFR